MLEISPNLVQASYDEKMQEMRNNSSTDVKRCLLRLGYKYLGEYEQVKWTFVLDLDKKTPLELRAGFRENCRRQIRRAEKQGLRVRELSDGELDVVKSIIAETGKRQGFPDPDLEYYLSMKEAFGEKVRYMAAELPMRVIDETAGIDEYVPVAVGMFVLDKKEVVYLYGGSVKALQKHGGSYLLQWQMIQEAMCRRCDRYNFYGVLPVKGNGVYEFKLGFRGRVEELLGTFALPVGLLGWVYIKTLRKRKFGEMH